MSAGYRLLGQGAVNIDDCVRDVRRAVEHFGRLAALRGIEASRQASGGSSAGAHLAMVAAMIAPDKPVPATEPGVAAVVALNPAGLDLLAFPSEHQRCIERQAGIAVGRLIDYSLIEFARPGNPPMLIHHGTDDEVEPIDNVRRFRDVMVRAHNYCKLLEYEDAEHGFHYPANSAHFDDVIDSTARFLADRSWESDALCGFASTGKRRPVSSSPRPCSHAPKGSASIRRAFLGLRIPARTATRSRCRSASWQYGRRSAQMSQNYDAAKAHFDDLCFRQGITPETDIVSYQDRKKPHPELAFCKVEHFQREVAAYGAALSGIEAAGRMLALPSHSISAE